MSALFDASPSTGSVRARPMTADEIDAHPDADRIWATVCELRDSVEDELERLEYRLDEARNEGSGHDAPLTAWRLWWPLWAIALALTGYTAHSVATATCGGCM